jgi:SOS response regulatory protein OraA/RecX
VIPHINGKALKTALIKQIREELHQRGYSEKAIEEILKWYK